MSRCLKQISCFVSGIDFETSSRILRRKGEADARAYSLTTAGEILPGEQVRGNRGSYGKSGLRRGGSMRAHLHRSRTFFTSSSVYCTQDVREQQIEGCFFGRQNCPSAFINNYKIFFFVTSLTKPHSEHFHALLDGPRYILLLRQAGQSIQYFTLAYMLDFQSMV